MAVLSCLFLPGEGWNAGAGGFKRIDTTLP
jgi:hypothetical protein